MRLRSVVITGLCLVVPGALIIGLHGLGSSSGTSRPSAPATASAIATARPAAATALALPVALPQASPIWDTDTEALANAQQTAQVTAAVRAEVWRIYAIGHGRGEILSRLADRDSYLGPYAAAIAAAGQGETTATTPESVTEATIGQLTAAERSHLAQGGILDGDTQAVVLQLEGGILGPEAAAQGGTGVVFVGHVVNDPELGSVWVASYIGLCPGINADLAECIG